MAMSAPMTTMNGERGFLAAATAAELDEWIGRLGQPRFRGAQIIDWIYRKGVTDPTAMANLPTVLRTAMSKDFITGAVTTETETAANDGTRKLLLRLDDGESIECAIITAPDRVTFCLSTQVGCPVGCRFCASGADGLIRNLDTGEIMEQFAAARLAAGQLPDNVVFMGIGEGLLNFNHLVKAMELMSDGGHVGLGARRLTVSTSGWTPGIKRLADLKKAWNLAVSLHAPDDETRRIIIPDKFRRPIAEIIEACEYFRRQTGRMVTFEYTLVAGLNDGGRHAADMARLARKCRAKVNLIPCNPNSNPDFKAPTADKVDEFERRLKNAGVQVTTRIRKGGGVNAACGQLRATTPRKIQVFRRPK